MGKQFNVTLPDDLADLLEEVAECTGRNKSQMIAIWTREGLYREIEQLKTIEGWRTLRIKNRKVKETDDD